MDDPLNTQYFVVSGDTYCKQLGCAKGGEESLLKSGIIGVGAGL